MCQAPEDLLHLLTCLFPRAKKIRYDASTFLRKAVDDSPGTSALLCAVQQWSSAPKHPVRISYGDATYATRVDDVIHRQTTTGWVNLYRGFIRLHWGWISDCSDHTPSTDSRHAAIPCLATTLSMLHYKTTPWLCGLDVISSSTIRVSSVCPLYTLPLITILLACTPFVHLSPTISAATLVSRLSIYFASLRSNGIAGCVL
jgi:hypothetical protein